MDDLTFDEQRDDLLESIEKDRQEIRVAVGELADSAGMHVDLRARIRSAPLAWTIGAFLLGTWLGTRSGPGNDDQRRRTQ